MRGRSSAFSQGDGLAIAGGAEDETYALDELIYDLANLDAGFRFCVTKSLGWVFGDSCHERFGLQKRRKSHSGRWRDAKRGCADGRGHRKSRVTVEGNTSSLDLNSAATGGAVHPQSAGVAAQWAQLVHSDVAHARRRGHRR